MPFLTIVGRSLKRRDNRRPFVRISPAATLSRVDVSYDEWELERDSPGLVKHASVRQVSELLFDIKPVKRLLKEARAEDIHIEAVRDPL